MDRQAMEKRAACGLGARDAFHRSQGEFPRRLVHMSARSDVAVFDLYQVIELRFPAKNAFSRARRRISLSDAALC